LAKLAASLHKPDGLDVITHENLEAVYSSVELLDLCGINTRYQARRGVHAGGGRRTVYAVGAVVHLQRGAQHGQVR
jgi:nucleotidyltransferase/DNA polymerase involved in DNA repair